MLHQLVTNNKDAAELCAIAALMLEAKFQNFDVKEISMKRKLAKAKFPLGCSFNPDKKGEKVVYYNPMNPKMSPTDADASEGKRAICLKDSVSEAKVGLPSLNLSNDRCDERDTCIYNCQKGDFHVGSMYYHEPKSRYECIKYICKKELCKKKDEKPVGPAGPVPTKLSVSGMDGSFVVSVFAFIGAMTLIWYAARAFNKTYVNSEFTAINKEVP